MNIICRPIQQLTADEISAWSQIQESVRCFDSPFYRPEFAQAVAAGFGGGEVAIMVVDGKAVGFWPFERIRPHVARSLGGGMSDFQGVICAKGPFWRAEQLLTACNLTVWEFDHLLVSQQQFLSFHRRRFSSPYMDLSDGFESYRASLSQQRIAQIFRLERKLEREFGPVRLEAHTGDHGDFNALIDWKKKKHGITAESVSLLEAILTYQEAMFSGMLTALYAGDRLVAAHFGMRSGPVLHAWFPAYDADFHPYSPGLIMWIELAKKAKDLGIERIDLGRDKSGVSAYKKAPMSDSTEVAEGFVAVDKINGLLRSGAYMVHEWLHSPRLRAPARKVRDRVSKIISDIRR